MSVLYIVVPLAFVIAGGALAAFIWAVKDGQFDDLDTPGKRVALDDDAPASPKAKNDSPRE